MQVDKDGFISLEIDYILNAENDYSQWRDRDDMWMSRKWNYYLEIAYWRNGFMYIRIVEITAPTKLQLNIFLDYL